ncbi:unnamed protein product [Cunninghamella echinulata]
MKPKVSAITNLTELLYRYWRRSLLHDTFSISLPILEEVAFEEKFKYLIVTSPLLSDTLSIHTKQQKYHHTPPPFHTASAHTRSGKIGTIATLSGLFVALGIEKFVPSRIKTVRSIHNHNAIVSFTPTITMTLASGVSLYFIYRHLRRSSIRKLYQRALTQLQEVLEYSQLLDSKVHKALLTIQEIELVSRGYRLSTPLSPISRIEQTSKTKRCSQLRFQLAKLLRRAFIIYEEAIIDMTDSINKQSLSRLFDMYNIHSIASLSALGDYNQQQQDYNNTNDGSSSSSSSNSGNNGNNGSGITLDYLKTLAHLMHLKRRECMLQFLALSIMTSGHDSMRKGYESGWMNINSVLAKLVHETRGFAKDVVVALESEFSKSINDIDETVPTSNEVTDAHFRQFVHRLSSLEQQLRTMEARVYLCHDELRNRQQLIANMKEKKEHPVEIEKEEENNNDDELMIQQKLLKKEYMTMEKDMQQMILEWESGKNALDSLLSPSITTLNEKKQNEEALPSPLPSPTLNDQTNSLDKQTPPYLITADEHSELFQLPLPAKASVFETIADVLEKNNHQLPIKKSRAERIEEMKRKREKEVKEKSSRLDSQNMVYELKNVLDRRILDLDLSNDDEKQ